MAVVPLHNIVIKYSIEFHSLLFFQRPKLCIRINGLPGIAPCT